MVGVGTALADDPELTVRDVDGENPLRVVFDPDGILPITLNMIQTAKDIPTCIITGPHSTPVWRDRMTAKAVRLIETEHIGILGLKEGLLELGKQGVQSVLAEGGGKLQSMLAELDCIDRLDLFIAPKLVGKGIRMMLVPPHEMEKAMVFEANEWRRSGSDAHFTGILHQYYTGDGHKHPEKE